MLDTSQFSEGQPLLENMEQMDMKGATCDAFRVKIYGKLHFLKRLKADYAHDIRYQEAQRKEFEAGYRLEHPNIVRYISLTDDGLLMEYIDGKTLTQALVDHPDYFHNEKNTDRILCQLLDAVAYLHSHQILHLDLKPDNVMITRIGHDVKLVDLGFSYTDTFTDTMGRTDRFAAPEQLSGGGVDERTDIYAIGKLIEQLPNHHIYNKVIARCTAANPQDRYQSVQYVLNAVSQRHRSHWSVVAVALLVLAGLLATCLYLISLRHPVITPIETETLIQVAEDTVSHTVFQPPKPQDSHAPVSSDKPSKPAIQKDDLTVMKEEATLLIDKVYQQTIASFCDSVFPSPSVGQHWAKASTEFHAQVTHVSDQLVKKYPDLPETSIRQETEQQFQNLVSFVFGRMRENGED